MIFSFFFSLFFLENAGNFVKENGWNFTTRGDLHFQPEKNINICAIFFSVSQVVLIFGKEVAELGTM